MQKGKFGFEFFILSVALPVNLANVKNVLKSVNYRKTPISQNALGMGDSRLSQLTRKSFTLQPLPLKISEKHELSFLP